MGIADPMCLSDPSLFLILGRSGFDRDSRCECHSFLITLSGFGFRSVSFYLGFGSLGSVDLVQPWFFSVEP